MRPLPIALVVLFLLAGCDTSSRPRPRGFHRLELPARQYATFASPTCPFQFQYPAYGQVDTRRIDSCYVDIRFPQLGATWHITSRLVDGRPGAASEDYRRLIYKHAQKADEIRELRLEGPTGGGVYYEIYGEVPTSAQVFYTDSNRYALTVSFYFNTALKNDSLQPIIDYMKTDLQHLVRTLQWQTPTAGPGGTGRKPVAGKGAAQKS